MPTRDPAKIIKDALVTASRPATLHVDDDWRPTTEQPATLLVADDGGPAVHTGPWPWAEQPQGYSAPFRKRPTRRPLIRMTAFAEGRSKAREVVEDAADWLIDNRPSDIARIEDVSEPLITRDPDTGNFLASVLIPVIVRPL